VVASSRRTRLSPLAVLKCRPSLGLVLQVSDEAVAAIFRTALCSSPPLVAGRGCALEHEHDCQHLDPGSISVHTLRCWRSTAWCSVDNCDTYRLHETRIGHLENLTDFIYAPIRSAPIPVAFSHIFSSRAAVIFDVYYYGKSHGHGRGADRHEKRHYCYRHRSAFSLDHRTPCANHHVSPQSQYNALFACLN
jgi:hypothetical protein